MEDDGKAHVTGLTDYDSTLAHEAAEQCPTEAIIEE
jgi:ferredoxin